MKHIQEEILYLLPPTCVDVLKFGIFCKRSQIFFSSLMEIPTVFCSHIYNASAYVLIGIVEYIIKECIKMFSEQLAQTIVSHSLMQQCLLNIKRTCMVGNDNGYLPCTLRVEAFCTLLLSIQDGSISNNLHIVKMQFLCKAFHTFCHSLAFTPCKFPPLLCRSP